MKYTVYLFALLFVGILSAQKNQNVTQNSSSLQRAGSAIQSSYGASALFYNPKKVTLGTEYLFDEWENSAVIHTKDKHRFLVKNINLNINRNAFSSRFAKDSIFTFNFNNIEKIILIIENSKIFIHKMERKFTKLYSSQKILQF